MLENFCVGFSLPILVSYRNRPFIQIFSEVPNSEIIRYHKHCLTIKSIRMNGEKREERRKKMGENIYQTYRELRHVSKAFFFSVCRTCLMNERDGKSEMSLERYCDGEGEVDGKVKRAD